MGGREKLYSTVNLRKHELEHAQFGSLLAVITGFENTGTTNITAPYALGGIRGKLKPGVCFPFCTSQFVVQVLSPFVYPHQYWPFEPLYNPCPGPLRAGLGRAARLGLGCRPRLSPSSSASTWDPLWGEGLPGAGFAGHCLFATLKMSVRASPISN